MSDEGRLGGGVGAAAGGGGGADGMEAGGGGGGGADGELVERLPNAFLAACMAMFPFKLDGVEGADGGADGGVDRDGGSLGAGAGGGGGGADDGSGLVEVGAGRGGCGGGGAVVVEDNFLGAIGGGGLFPKNDTVEDGLDTGFGGGLRRFATRGFVANDGDDSAVCGTGRKPTPFGTGGAGIDGRVGGFGADVDGGLGIDDFDVSGSDRYDESRLAPVSMPPRDLNLGMPPARIPPS